MSEAVSALAGAAFSGVVLLEDTGPAGMVTIRGDLADAAFAKAVKSACGVALPGQRQSVTAKGRRLLWMSPDELMLVCAHDEADSMAGALGAALKGQHHLAVNVSDARVLFRLSGEDGALREVLAKLTPADMRASHLPVDEVRRTRLAQVAAAFWFEAEGEARLVAFRSVAKYVFDLISTAAAPGGEVGHFR